MEEKKLTPLEIKLIIIAITAVFLAFGFLLFKGWSLYASRKATQQQMEQEDWQKQLKPFIARLSKDLKAATKIKGGENHCTFYQKNQTITYYLLYDAIKQSKIYRLKHLPVPSSEAVAEGIRNFKLSQSPAGWQLTLEGKPSYWAANEYLVQVYNFSPQTKVKFLIKPADLTLPYLDRRSPPLF